MKQFESSTQQEQDQVDIFSLLKRGTFEIHEKVMQESWAQRVLTSDYTLNEYIELLQKYYGFYAPLETQLLAHQTSVFHPSRVKLHLLREDLSFLKSDRDFTSIICQKLPEIDGPPSALGICYVLEGATLGGQIIARHLKNSLGLKEQVGLKFFIGYGADTANMWRSFKAETRELIRTPQASAAVLKSAINTFNYLSDWMETK